MSHPIARRSLLRSLAGVLGLPLLPRGARPALPDEAPGVFTADGQPVPAECIVAQLPTRPATAIYRRWRTQDVPKCRLCPDGCTANGDQCMIIVSERVKFADAWLYSTRDVTMVKNPGG